MVVAATAVALSMMIAAATQDSAPPADVPDVAALPISLDRIRDGLDRPALKIPPPTESLATFRTSIEGKAPVFESVLEGMRRDLARWSGAGSAGPQPPDVNSIPASRTQVQGTDVLPIIAGLRKKWNEARADRVRRDVAEELAAFCKVNDCTVLEGGVSTTAEGIVVPPQSN
jgi:hypothetical protein